MQTQILRFSRNCRHAVSSNAIKKITDNRDFYFIVIQKNASALLYATYFGQNDGPQSHQRTCGREVPVVTTEWNHLPGYLRQLF
ncbi:MAG: hypothetical protein WDM78_10255 [Puia sp.]